MSRVPKKASAVAEQLQNLADMAERVALPAFRQGFRKSIVARAQAVGSSLTYRDEQGRLVQEWPGTGRIQVLAD